MRRLRAAVIGLGVGEAHIAGYRAHPRCELVALCDFDPHRRAEIAARHPEIPITGDAAAILRDREIDIVSIASYDTYHCEQIVAAIDAGKHVFAEKPLCLSRGEAERIRAALREHPHVRLSSNLILRGSPRFVELRRRIQAGQLGQLFQLEGDYFYGRAHKIHSGWRGRIDYYSVVLGGAIHLVDLLLWLSGDRVVEVCAAGTRIASAGTQFRYDDHVVAVLRFASGAVGKVGSSYACVRPHFHALTLCGTRGSFVHTPEAGLLYTTSGDEPPERIDAPYPGVHKGDLIPGFVDAILAGRPAPVSTDDTFRTLAVCLAIEESAKSRRPQPVDDI